MKSLALATEMMLLFTPQGRAKLRDDLDRDAEWAKRKALGMEPDDPRTTHEFVWHHGDNWPCECLPSATRVNGTATVGRPQ